jgi:hypothetical protein
MIINQYKNIDTKQKTIVLIVLGLLAYNIPLITKYILAGHIIRDYNLSAYAFTYFNAGFIVRGLIPTVLDLLHLNNELGYLILYNITLIFYIYSIVYIAKLHKIEHNFYFIFSFIFLFFGIPHFVFDAFRTDMIIQLLAMVVYIFLYKEKILYSIVISLIAILIHEAAVFLVVPIFLLLINDAVWKKYGIAAILLVFTYLCLKFSHKTDADTAVKILQDFFKVEEVPKRFADIYTNEIGSNRKVVFSYMYQWMKAPNIIAIGGYLMLLIFSFFYLLKQSFFKYYWLFLFPLILCVIAVDFPRWICFAYFLAFIFSAHSGYFLKNRFFLFLVATIVLGIPIAVAFRYSLLEVWFWIF